MSCPTVTLYNHYLEGVEQGASNLRVVYDVAFDDLPFTAQEYIRALAVKEFANDFTNDPTRMRVLEDNVRSAYAALNTQHIRAVGVNLLDRAQTAYSIFRSRGTRPYLRNR